MYSDALLSSQNLRNTLLISFSEQEALELNCNTIMDCGGKTYRKDYIEGLRKMERSLKEGEPTKPPPRSHLEKFSADLEMRKYDLAFAKLAIFEAEAALKDGRPYMDAAEIEGHERRIADMRTLQADTERRFSLAEAECDEALRSK